MGDICVYEDNIYDNYQGYEGGGGSDWCSGCRKVVVQLSVGGIHPQKWKFFQLGNCSQQQLGDMGCKVCIF